MNNTFKKNLALTFILLIGWIQVNGQTDKSNPQFLAGSAMSVITPPIGTSINGSFQDRTVENIHDETHARAIQFLLAD
jgi:hypothetical protein